MQTASGTLAAAIQGRERQPAVTVTADFHRDGSATFDPGVFSDTFSDTFRGLGNLNDLTPFAVSASVDRSLSTDLPDAAKIDSGSGAAAGSVVLAGTLGGIDLTELFSAYHNPLTDLAPRITTPVRVAMGMRTSAGVETLPQLAGSVRDCRVDTQAGTVTLDLLDYRDRLRTPVVFPVLVADDWNTVRPGLNAQWLMDVIARANGFYASPPTRAQCFLSATLHGSMWPEVGTLVGAGLTSGANARGQATFLPLTGGLLGIGAPMPLSASYANYTVAAGLNTNTGSNVFVEARARFVVPGFTEMVFIWSPSGVWEISVNLSVGLMQVAVRRNGVTGSANVSLATLTQNVDHYIGVHIAMTAGGFTVNAKVDGTSGSASGVVGNPAGSPSLTNVQVTTHAAEIITSALQVTNEPFSAGMFNNAFTPTAVFEQAFNELVATPTVDTSDPWALLQQLADAEQGIVLFDENGVLRFYNRTHLSSGSPVATLTTDPSVSWANLKALASAETGDSVRNFITVPALPPALDPPNTVIWAVTEILSVPAFGSITVPAEVPAPIYTLTSAGYQAAVNADGTGGDVSNLTVGAIRTGPTTFNIVVSNPNAFDVFLVNNSTVPLQTGDPALILTGRCVRVTDDGYKATYIDNPSVVRFGMQTLDLSGNAFRQSTTTASNLATYLGSVLPNMHPVLDGVQVVGDPRAQLADRVRVQAGDGQRLDDEFWTVGITTTIEVGGGLSQAVALRSA